MIWIRFYNAEKEGKKMIESDIDDYNDNINGNKKTKGSNNN